MKRTILAALVAAPMVLLTGCVTETSYSPGYTNSYTYSGSNGIYSDSIFPIGLGLGYGSGYGYGYGGGGYYNRGWNRGWHGGGWNRGGWHRGGGWHGGGWHGGGHHGRR